MAFVIANLLTCLADIYFGFFAWSNEYPDNTSVVIYFIGKVAVLGPINFVIFVHKRCFFQERREILRQRSSREVSKQTIRAESINSIEDEVNEFAFRANPRKVSINTYEVKVAEFNNTHTDSN